MDDKIVEFLDHGREPHLPFKREHWWGIDIGPPHKGKTCLIELPWPAPRIGVYFIACKTCGNKTICTVAGRVDDPRSLALLCLETTKH